MLDTSQRIVLAKVTRRLLPFLFLLYVVNILDRVNIGIARLQMLPDLDMDEGVFGLAAGIFYLGYVAFEVPSNLILRRVGARRWIARILVSWGLITCAMMAIRTPATFYLLRILLGFAEAGFFPGVILYLTYWFPARQRAKTVAYFMAASPLTGVLGNPLSGAILQYMDQVGGLRGWKWLFLLEGTPAVILGFVALWYLTDRPAQATWLTAEERDGLTTELAQEEARRQQRHGLVRLQALASSRVWLLIGLYFTIAVASNAFGFYLPTLVKARFVGATDFQVGLLAAAPNLCAIVCMLLNGAHSDRSGERRFHVAVPAFLAALGWILYAWLDLPVPSLLALALIQIGIMSTLPTFWSLPTSFLSGVAAAGGIALINSVGNLGGFVGPNVLGQSKTLTGSFTGGLLTMALTLGVGGCLALCVRRDPVEPAEK